MYQHQGKPFCFVEDYDYAAERACIAVYDLSGEGATRLGEALVEPFHLSFPYLFEHQGNLYMAPECCESRQVRIYECMEFPLRWKLKKTVMNDVSAADPMFFQHDDKWWLMLNIDPSNSGEHCSELQIFYADDPFSDQWQPHPLNPIFVDSRKARNAGLLKHGDALFRVAQRQGFSFYGKGKSINQIKLLTPTDYQEVEIANIDASFAAGAEGTHHMHSNGEYTVFDFVRWESTN